MKTVVKKCGSSRMVYQYGRNQCKNINMVYLARGPTKLKK